MSPQAENDLYNEWSSGVSLANVTDNNQYFREIETELDNPGNFAVSTDQLPENTVVAPVEVPVPAETHTDEGPEVIQLSNGGELSIEKTSKGWKAVLDSKEPNIPAENFYGENLKKLAANLAKGKLEASKVILKLKREKLLGGDETVKPAAATPPVPHNVAKVNVLTADDVYAIRNKLTSQDPVEVAEGLDEWVKRKFGLNPEEFAEALKSAPEAKRIVESQRTKADVEEVNKEFVENNPDYIELVSTSDPDVNKSNVRILVARVAKVYLNKKLTKSTSQAVVDDVIYELYNKGFWTAENLESAKDELIENGLFERSATPSNSQPKLQQVDATSVPSEPAAPRIAAKPGQPVGVSLGISERNTVPSEVPAEGKPLSDLDLQKMPMEQLRQIAEAQLKAMQR